MDDNSDKQIAAHFEAVRVRFDAMDEASKVLSATVTRVPTDLQTAISGVDGRMKAQDDKFNVAIQALKDAAKERRDADREAIAKNDAYLISQQTQLIAMLTEMRSTLSLRVANLETKMATSDAAAGGARGYRDDARSSLSVTLAVIGTLVGIGGFATAMIAISSNRNIPSYTLTSPAPTAMPQVSVVPVVPVPVQPGR